MVNSDLNGQRITVNAGEEIQVELGGVGGTGYSWYLDRLDKDLIEIVDEGTRAKSETSERIGGNPVIMFWRLKALQAGITAVKIDYYRVWEGKGTAINHFEVEILILP